MVTVVEIESYADARCALMDLPVTGCAHCHGHALEPGTALTGDASVPWLELGHEGDLP